MSEVRTSKKYVLKRTLTEFTRHQCTDLAAALTYYSVLAIFPTIVALAALLGVVGQAEESIQSILDLIDPLVSDDMMNTFEPVIRDLASSRATGVALVVGLGGALWSASAYVNGFSRAMNRIYEVEEGRPVWKLRPQMLLVTLAAVVVLAAAALMLVISGPLAGRIGEVLGLGDTAVTVWNIAKWPALGLLVLFLVALLYWATPNVQQPKFRWISPGTVLTLVTGLVAAGGFTFYVANFGSYDKTYGALAGVIVALVFLWIMNVVLLLGAQLDTEVQRMRQIGDGIAAESHVQLPLRDDTGVQKAAQKRLDAVTEAREMRVENAEDQLVPGEDISADVESSGANTPTSD
ncbi:YihY/virulence factor BrkB family protein [Nocardioides yefusunii]|uniref:YihY/virulence factor BrkB family protein n=1 Tax=Nocardioides yefusunii TaxID=2500546 RepID=A0ABW1QWK5_9ACTN|nr:YihY/virulence factor BrkB family protein [Nocardioides yefusunii]